MRSINTSAIYQTYKVSGVGGGGVSSDGEYVSYLCVRMREGGRV